MTLRQKQSLFVSLVVELIHYGHTKGYEFTFGETYRSPEEAARLAGLGKGIRKSLHTQRLAIDLNLFRNGEFLTKSEDHRPLGEFWKTLHPLCRWGGDFTKPDGNHYSLEHLGRQ